MATIDTSRGGNLFLAVLPDADASAQIYQQAEIIRHAHGFTAPLTPRDRLHVTLLPLNGLAECVEQVCDAINAVRSAPFEVAFDRTVSFRGRPGSWPFVLTGGDGLDRLKSLRRSLAAAFRSRGLGILGRREFTPHVTLLFSDRVVEENPIWPIGWTVRDLILIHSMKGHRHLASWPLRV
ncbi:MAG TPA: 2'-5' RNA ligase family protein [Bradyrhizobium sp.]|jgi:2'-5' RNA ligase